MKTSTIVIFIIVLFCVLYNKKELFTNLSSIVLSEYDMYQIKNAIDIVVNNEYLKATKIIGIDYLKIIIDTFNKNLNIIDLEKQRELFESDNFIKLMFNDDKLNLSENFKKSLFVELSEAHLFNRNINMVPLRLYSSNKININNIKDNLQNIQLKKISKFFIFYLLKYYDNSKPKHEKNNKILRFENSLPSIKELNSRIKQSNLFFD